MKAFLAQALNSRPDSSVNPFCHAELPEVSGQVIEAQKDWNEWRD